MSLMLYNCSSLKKISNANEIIFTVANNCKIDNIHAGCTKDFGEKIIIEMAE
jgi:hypothetical protein